MIVPRTPVIFANSLTGDRRIIHCAAPRWLILHRLRELLDAVDCPLWTMQAYAGTHGRVIVTMTPDGLTGYVDGMMEAAGVAL